MLALQLCDTALIYLPAVPPPLYMQLAEAAYQCPARLTQAEQTRSLSAFAQSRKLTDGTWRVIDPSQLNLARPGDGVLLPADPTDLLWRPSLARHYRDLRAKGVTLVLNAPDMQALPALATTFTGLGLMPGAVMLGRAPAQSRDFTPGTYLLRDIRGLAPLPQVARLGDVAVIPYLPDAQTGQRATPDSAASTFHPHVGLRWKYAGQGYDSAHPAEGAAHWVAVIMPVAWAVGRLLTVSLPSLIYTASDSVAWVVLGLLILTLLAIFRILVRPRTPQGGPS